MKINFKNNLLLTALSLTSMAVMAGNPNGGGGSGVDQTARNAAATASASAANAQTTADNNATAITALQKPTVPAIGTDLTSTKGGKVACTFDSGGDFNLIASSADESTDVAWSNLDSTEIGASAQSDYFGRFNSTAIIAQAGFTAGAAKLCRDKTSGGFTDWYLPAKVELNCLFTNKGAIGGFASSNYWSSTEDVAANAWLQGFVNGFQNVGSKNFGRRVRCVRAFTP